ncbi:hypothetical protein [Brachybacterium sp. AOP29-B2-41]|uniref:hypothetical protein n=1 Tax=Brachybacterium sp. AOP29-B2-41 TaxID=3457704 RepID=UPI0040345465
MTFLGADTEALRAQAELTDTRARQLDGLSLRLGIAVRTATWIGPDVERFREDFESRVLERIEEALEDLRRRLEGLRREAEEQDAASDGDGGGSLWDTITQWLEDYEPLQSDGFWGDLLGEDGLLGLDIFAGVTSAIDVVGMFDVGTWGDVLNIVGDASTMGIAVYDGLQAFQDGDLFGVLDAAITYNINGLDLAFTTVGMIPHPVTKLIGGIGGIATGALDIAWNGLTVATAHNPDSVGGGSPSRALLEAPGDVVEMLTGWSGLREGTDTVLDGAQDLFQDSSEGIRDAVPILDPIIDGPQRIVEGVGDLVFG